MATVISLYIRPRTVISQIHFKLQAIRVCGGVRAVQKLQSHMMCECVTHNHGGHNQIQAPSNKNSNTIYMPSMLWCAAAGAMSLSFWLTDNLITCTSHRVCVVCCVEATKIHQKLNFYPEKKLRNNNVHKTSFKIM